MNFLWGAILISAVAAPPSADSHALVAYQYLRRLPPKDAEHCRFLSYYNYARHPIGPTRIRTMRFWINQLHLESGTSFAQEVPGSDGLLYAVDLREFGWSPAAWSAVARREPYFREPAVDSATAILVRRHIRVDQDPKTLHLDAVVRADWFFRETFELDRSPSYHDLLYSKFRFRRVVVREASTQRYSDQYGRVYDKHVPAVVKNFVNFPKNEAELERLFAVDRFRDHLREFRIDTRHGAVVEGIENGVSIVARQNRLIERILTHMGAWYKSFDVKETSGDRDFAETLNKNFKFDAGEILFDLPAGGMGTLLVDSKGNIVNVADNRFAQDSSDFRYDSRVRAPGSCFICHELKYIQPKNLVRDLMRAGIDIKFRRKEARVSAKGFFLDWEDKLEHEQSRFERFISRTSGFRPGDNALHLKEWRNEYDQPVDLTKAASECGVTVADFKRIVRESTRARIHMLVAGMTIPRRTWEVDGYPEFVLQKNARKR